MQIRLSEQDFSAQRNEDRLKEIISHLEAENAKLSKDVSLSQLEIADLHDKKLGEEKMRLNHIFLPSENNLL